ncbi:MAG: hypothetical protein IPJ25_02300 [Rhodocyclaceae bacterium]|nr:hypothetical protein [Rhodocyclaceae bacterium]
MEKLSRILVNVIGVLTLLGALGFMFSPAQMEPDFSILPTRLDGWGTLLKPIGWTISRHRFVHLFGARAGKSQWLRVPVIFMATFLFGRTVHILIDGVSQPAIRSFLVEVVLLVVLETSRRALTKVDRGAGAKP